MIFYSPQIRQIQICEIQICQIHTHLDLLDSDIPHFFLSPRSLEHVFKTCLQDLLKTCLEDVFKVCLQNVCFRAIFQKSLNNFRGEGQEWIVYKKRCIFHNCSSVSLVHFEHVIAGSVVSLELKCDQTIQIQLLKHKNKV